MIRAIWSKFKLKLFGDLSNKLKSETNIISNKIDILEQKIDSLHIKNNGCVSENNFKLSSSVEIIRVLFLVQNGEFWPALASIFEAMKQNDKFQPIILIIPTRYSESVDYEYKCTDLFDVSIDNVFIYDDFKHVGLDSLSCINPDIIFRQAPWDHLIPDCFRTNSLKQYRICYVPYAIHTLEMGNVFYNQSLHHFAWRLYCDNNYLMNCYRTYNLMQDINAKIVGSTKFEYMNYYLNKISINDWPLTNKSNTVRVKILWCSHHSLENWLGFATLHKNYNDVVSFAKHHPDYDIVFRPHPATKTAFVSNNKMSEEDYDEFINNLESLANVYVDTSSEYLYLFQHSDVLVTDGISFLFEYLITKKPIIFIDSLTNVGFNDFYKKFEDSWYKIIDINELQNIIEKLLDGDDPLKLIRYNYLTQIYNDSAIKPSKLVIDDILNSYNKYILSE